MIITIITITIVTMIVIMPVVMTMMNARTPTGTPKKQSFQTRLFVGFGCVWICEGPFDFAIVPCFLI